MKVKNGNAPLIFLFKKKKPTSVARGHLLIDQGSGAQPSLHFFLFRGVELYFCIHLYYTFDEKLNKVLNL